MLLPQYFRVFILCEPAYTKPIFCLPFFRICQYCLFFALFLHCACTECLYQGHKATAPTPCSTLTNQYIFKKEVSLFLMHGGSS